MSRADARALWQRLREAGAVEGELPEAPLAATPWYVRVMLGVSGWIGAAFLFGFIGAALSGVMRSAPASMLIGALACGAAALMLRGQGRNDFATQFAIAMSFAGQALFVTGLVELFGTARTGLYLGVFALELVLTFAVSNFIHRMVTSWLALAVFGMLLKEWGLGAFAPAVVAGAAAWVVLNEARLALNGRFWRPVCYGLVLAMLHTGVDWFFVFGPDVSGYQSRLMLRNGLLGAVLVWTAWQLLAREQVPLASNAGMAALAGAGLLALLALNAPGVVAALLILLFGFAGGRRLLAGLGLAALLASLALYYYQTQLTLLEKSLLLAASGVAMLAARYAIERCFRTLPGGEGGHA